MIGFRVSGVYLWPNRPTVLGFLTMASTYIYIYIERESEREREREFLKKGKR